MEHTHKTGSDGARPAPSDRGRARLDATSTDAPRTDVDQAMTSAPFKQPADLQASSSLVGETHEANKPRPITSERDEARTDAVIRDDTRPAATERVEPRSHATVRDDFQTSIVGDDDADEELRSQEHWLDVEQAAEPLRERGTARTIRTVQKMCKRGDLIARLVPTENGVRYIINEQSVHDFVQRDYEKLPTGGLGEVHSSEREDAASSAEAREEGDQIGATGPVNAKPAEINTNQAADLRDIIDLKNEQIAMLRAQAETANAQISVKDEQIATMLERDHETNILIQNLQGLVALPQGRSQAPTEPQPTQRGPIDLSGRRDVDAN